MRPPSNELPTDTCITTYSSEPLERLRPYLKVSQLAERIMDDSRLATLMKAAQTGDGEAYVQLLGEITPHLRLFIHCRH